MPAQETFEKYIHDERQLSEINESLIKWGYRIQNETQSNVLRLFNEGYEIRDGQRVDTIQVGMIQGDQSKPSQNFGWQVISFDSDQMQIQLTFENPDLISSGERKDLFFMRANAQELIVDIEDNYIDLGFEMMNQMPIQATQAEAQTIDTIS